MKSIIIIFLLVSTQMAAQNTWVKWDGHVYLKQGNDSIYFGDDDILSTMPAILSGTNIKTINGLSLLGNGNLVVLATNGNGSSLTGLTKTQVGLANADNTSDANKPVSSAAQTALNLKANLASPTFTGTVSGITSTMVGLGNVTNESKATLFTSPAFTGTPTGITAAHVGLGNVANESKATMFASPTFTGSVSGITSGMVGLGNVTNESKATMFANPTFTGTVAGVTAAHVGLGNSNNTSDANKPISTATQSALDAKQATLVSATNIKTINGATVLGSGDLVVSGSGVSRVFLPNDVVNNNGSANTIADVTGLSFPVVANTTYKFKFVIIYSSAATTTGSRWCINGPATTHMSYSSIYPTSATAITNNTSLAGYNLPSGSNASSLTTNNRCIIEGEIRPSADGNVIARFASEISASAITAIASGRSYVEYQIIN